MEFSENDMIHRHPEGAIHARVGWDPPVGQARHFAEIRGKCNQFGAMVTRFDCKVCVGRTGHIEVAADHDDVFAIEPVSALGYIGLFAPGLRRSRRKVRVEIVEAQDGCSETVAESASQRRS